MEEYNVLPGDTLIGLSIRFGTTVSQIKKKNRLWSDSIVPGQKLLILPSVNSDDPSKKSKEESHLEDFGFEESNPPSSEKISDKKSTAFSYFGSLFRKSQKSEQDPTKPILLDPSNLSVPSEDNHLITNPAFTLSNPSPTTTTIPSSSTPSSDILSLAPPELILPKFGRGQSGNEHLSRDRQILTQQIANQLQSFLPEYIRSSPWTMVYSLIGHGTDLRTFYEHSKKHEYTVLIVRTLEGEIFGGFNTEKWKTALKFYGTGQSFVFRCHQTNSPTPHIPSSSSSSSSTFSTTSEDSGETRDNEGAIQVEVEVWQWSAENPFIMWGGEDCVAMGGGGDGFAFSLNHNFIQGHSSSSQTFRNPILAGSRHQGRGGGRDGGVTTTPISPSSQYDSSMPSSRDQEQQTQTNQTEGMFQISNVELWGIR